MNLFGLLLQSFIEKQTREQTDKLREAGMRAAEKGRKMAIAGVLFTLGGAFLFSAILIFVIELGLQFDKAQGLSFSGLMLSSVILVVCGFLFSLIGWLSGQDSAHVAYQPPPPPPRNELKSVLEEVALTLLKEFLQAQKTPRTTDERETR